MYILGLSETLRPVLGEDKSADVFGIKPIGEALNTTVKKSFEGVEGFLKLVCAPALEEIGLLLKDEVRHWRLNNIMRILEKAKGKLAFSEDKLEIKAHPRVALSIIENGSLIDDEELQELWAGLFASSCTKDGQDDENLIFVDLLKQLTIIEAKILDYSCSKSRKILHENGLITGDELSISTEELFAVTNNSDIYRLDRELDHMRSLELLPHGGGFSIDGKKTLTAYIPPSALALNLYLKCKGYNGPPTKFWATNIITNEELQKEYQELEKEYQELEKARLAALEEQEVKK